MSAGAIAELRARTLPPARRALAAAFLAAGLDPHAQPPVPADPGLRHFAFGIAHADATPYDGRQRSGTITYVDAERIEQYVGAQQWVVYPAAMIDPQPRLGDQIRVSRRGEQIAIEAIGTNRIAALMPASEARSGMTVRFAEPPDGEGLARDLAAVAERYQARTIDDGGTPGTIDVAGAAAVHARLHGSTLRIETQVRADRPAAALIAERALVLFAAIAAAESPQFVEDDGGALFACDDLVGLAQRNEMRADAFAFAAALARRHWPAPPSTVGDAAARGGDELILFGSHERDAAAARELLQRAIASLAIAATRNDDPVIPCGGTLSEPDAGLLRPLVRLEYARVAIDVLWLDATADAAGVRALREDRRDVAALLGAPLRSAIVFAYAPVEGFDGTSDACELDRADTIVTALAAVLGRDDDAVAVDATGRLYAADELVTRALHRRGRHE